MSDVTFGLSPLRQTDVDSDPVAIIDTGFVYWKDLGSGNELYAEDESGNVVQITKEGGINQRGQICFTIAGALEVGTNLAFPFRPSGVFTIEEVYVECKAAPTGAAIIIDINKGGTTIFTDPARRPQIADGGTAATSGVPNIPGLVKNDQLTVDIDQIGSGDTGENLTIQIRGTTA